MNAATRATHFTDELFDNNELFESKLNWTVPPTVIKQYECLVSVLGAVSTAPNLAPLWNFSEQRFRKNVANWKNCGTFETSAGTL